MNGELESSTLLLYLADEIPAEQRQAIEARLKADPALARELEQLAASLSAMQDGLERDDLRLSPTNHYARSLRDVGQAMRTWHGQSAGRVSVVERPTSWHWRQRWWLYPTAAAAAVALGSLAWWTRQPVTPEFSRPVAVAPAGPPGSRFFGPAYNGWTEANLVEAIQQDPLAHALAPDPGMLTLGQAEQDMTELSQSADEPDLSGIFLGLGDDLPGQDEMQ